MKSIWGGISASNFHRFWWIFGAKMGQKPTKIDQYWHRKNDEQKDGCQNYQKGAVKNPELSGPSGS